MIDSILAAERQQRYKQSTSSTRNPRHLIPHAMESLSLIQVPSRKSAHTGSAAHRQMLAKPIPTAYFKLIF
jgi:hypothetical protein